MIFTAIWTLAWLIIAAVLWWFADPVMDSTLSRSLGVALQIVVLTGSLFSWALVLALYWLARTLAYF